mgnify:CR=1 FL=1
MKRLKKSMSMLLALLMLISVFAGVTVTADAARTDKVKTSGMFNCIVLNDLGTDDMIFINDWGEVHNDAQGRNFSR